MMKNSIILNNRQIEQALQRLEDIEALTIGKRLDQLEGAIESEVNILKMLKEEMDTKNTKTIPQ
jgi:predicted NUDIX family phosphoesterase